MAETAKVCDLVLLVSSHITKAAMREDGMNLSQLSSARGSFLLERTRIGNVRITPVTRALATIERKTVFMCWTASSISNRELLPPG